MIRLNLKKNWLKLESAGKLPRIGENWQLVANDPDEFKKKLVEVGDCMKITT